MAKAAKTSPPDDDKNPDLWLERHGDILYRFALARVKSSELAEDLVQDTLVSAIRSIDGFKGKSTVRTWLVQILKNKIIDHARKMSRRKTTSLDEEYSDALEGNFTSFGIWNRILSDWAGNPDEALSQKEFFEALEGCLSGLNDRARTAFTMKVIDGMDSEDICNTLDISTSNLWVVLHRARMSLRDCLEANWFEAKDK